MGKGKKARRKLNGGRCLDCGRIRQVSPGIWKRQHYRAQCYDCGGYLKRCNYERSTIGRKNPYPASWTPELRTLIRRRDGLCCQMCGRPQEDEARRCGHGLHVHHLDWNKSNCGKGNLIALCGECHFDKAHGKPKWMTRKQVLAIVAARKESEASIPLADEELELAYADSYGDPCAFLA